jgi:methionine salvage enolase-phosphatase E1
MKFITGQVEKVRQDVSMQGYKDDSPYRNNPFNTIYGTPEGTSITMEGVSTPLIGIDEFGNRQEMFPGQEYQYPGSRVIETPMAKRGGTWFGNADMMSVSNKYQQAGTVKKPKLGAGKYYTTTGDIVDWGTPEYERAYNRGEVLSEDGVRSEVTLDGGKLDEVVIKNNYKNGFWENYRDKIIEEGKDSGVLGAIIGVPINAVASLPQLALMNAMTGKVQRPSEAWGFENNEGWFDSPSSFGKNIANFGMDAVTDPADWFGVGELTAAGRLTKAKALSKLKNIPTSIAPELRQGLQTNGFLDIFKSKKPITTSVENLAQPTVSKPWEIQNLPGLHLQSTMDNGAISRIVEPKTGLINTEQALAIIGKESGGADKVALIKKGLGETIPKKMDYNDFRKVVQDQLIPLEHNISTSSKSNYGLGSLGYPSPSVKSYKQALSNTEESINNVKKYLEQNNIKQLEYEFKPVYEVTDPNGYKQLFHTMDEAAAAQKQSIDVANQNIKSMTANRAKTLEEMKSLPLENETLLLSNKSKFGKGSNAHNNPDETLGHIHYLIDSETPDIITATQLQSDALQGTHRIMPKTFDPEKAKYTVQRMAEIQEKNIATLNKMKAEGAADHEIKQMQEIVDAQELQNVLQKGHVENFTQKSLLDKDHQSRFLQEFVNYAAQKGGINKVRLPTYETAANVQGYVKQNLLPSDITSVLKSNKIEVPSGTSKETLVNELQELINSSDNVNLSNIKNKIVNIPEDKLYSLRYDDESQTILKKYSEQPKLIKKLFGEEPKIVTDSKGNTWYEFDIPKKFKEGKGEIKALSTGGAIGTAGVLSQTEKKEPISGMKKGDVTKLSELDKLAIQELGGMLYANKDAGLPHKQSVTKYLSAQNNLLDFMKRIKVVGGPVPFDEYYRENIINPRNKS